MELRANRAGELALEQWGRYVQYCDALNDKENLNPFDFFAIPEEIAITHEIMKLMARYQFEREIERPS